VPQSKSSAFFRPFDFKTSIEGKFIAVASNTGGLSEIVEHDNTGTKVSPGSADSVAWGVTRVLLDPGYASWIKLNAYQKALQVYDWVKIAKQTKEFYEQVLKEYDGGSWKPT